MTPTSTNFAPSIKNGTTSYLPADDGLAALTVPAGYKVELFASEKEFPNLANPLQLSFDNKGRLWVAVAPTYPHYRPGDAMPNDKLLIYEDTDGDGKADTRRIVLGGFGTGDSHQMLNGLNWGFGGELWFTQGHHIYSRVETPTGVETLNRSGVWRWR
ncbi:MAG: dehydrogenase, partial [Gammaproteobacteria bacterium]|nr:dehydrogenase [Gammaproteobacteria bacterium]